MNHRTEWTPFTKQTHSQLPTCALGSTGNQHSSVKIIKMESVESGPERFWRESQRLETNLCTQPGGEMTRPAEHAPAIAEWIMYCSSGGDGYSGRQKPDVPGRGKGKAVPGYVGLMIITIILTTRSLTVTDGP